MSTRERNLVYTYLQYRRTGNTRLLGRVIRCQEKLGFMVYGNQVASPELRKLVTEFKKETGQAVI